MEIILEEILTLADDITGEMTNFCNDTCSLTDLEDIHRRVETLFNTIRIDGVCRADMETLNQLGLTEVETKYYSEVRSYIGSDVALEAEVRGDWTTIVLGGVLAALVALLSFFLGKFLGWMFASSTTLDSSSSKAQKGTKVRLTNRAEDMEVDISRFGKKGKGYSNVIALHNLGSDFTEGKAIQELFDAAGSALAELNSKLAMYKTSGELQGELLKIVNGRDLNQKAVVDAIAGEMKPSSITDDLVKDTYPTLIKVMGERLADVSTADRNGDSLAPGTIMAKSQQVCNFRGTEIFSKGLTAKTKIELIIDPNKLNSGITQKEADSLKGDVDKLKKYQEAMGKGGSGKELQKRGLVTASLGVKGTDFLIKKYANYQISYPAQYLNTLVGKVISGLMKAHVEYRHLQNKFHKNYGEIFYEAEMVKLITAIEATSLPTDDKNKLIVKVGETRGKDITESAEIIASILIDLEKEGQEVKDKLAKIKFYQRTKGSLTSKGSDLTSKLHEVI